MKAEQTSLPMPEGLSGRKFIRRPDLSAFVREHFFIKQETPYLMVFLTYRTGRHSVADTAGPKDKESWQKLLSDDQLPLFNTLREWRAELAKQKGIPPYLICTNRQFAQIVNERPTTLAGLRIVTTTRPTTATTTLVSAW